MKKLLPPLLLIAATLGLLGLFIWSPWASDTRQRELDWLRAYAAWLDGQSCAAGARQEVETPPTARLQALANIARNACATAPDPPDWETVGWRVSAELIASHSRQAETEEEPRFARAAREIADTPVRAYCWPARDWGPFAEEWRLIDRDELWVAGFADPVAGEIHLSPKVCGPLRLFYETGYTPRLSEDTLDLADALKILAHEAEHVRAPGATEAEVECYSLQRVRGLARAAGRGKGYANELALLALEISYPQMPAEYRTRRCRDRGPLDLRPRDPVWP